MRKLLYFILLVLPSLSACAGVGHYDNLGNGLRVQLGRIASDGIKITANDGTFSLNSKQDFIIPFHMDCNVNLGWEQHLSMGAKPVRVSLANYPTQFHGVLAFCSLPTNAKGPATRSYELSIPDSYAESATGGRISSVYETVDVQSYAGADPKIAMLMSAKTQNAYSQRASTVTAWILWFSDRPFTR